MDEAGLGSGSACHLETQRMAGGLRHWRSQNLGEEQKMTRPCCRVGLPRHGISGQEKAFVSCLSVTSMPGIVLRPHIVRQSRLPNEGV